MVFDICLFIYLFLRDEWLDEVDPPGRRWQVAGAENQMGLPLQEWRLDRLQHKAGRYRDKAMHWQPATMKTLLRREGGRQADL